MKRLPVAICALFGLSWLMAADGENLAVSAPERPKEWPRAVAVRPLSDFTPRQLRVFLKGSSEDWRGSTDSSRGLPAPPSGKPVPERAAVHALVPPKQFAQRTPTVSEVIARRRSQRHFLPDGLSLEELSYLLWHAQGVTGAAALPGGESLKLRAAPSGGARYPLETYVFVRHVETLESGLYRYLPDTHELVETWRDPQSAEKLRHACFGAELIGSAAAVFAFTAVPYRTEWRYGIIAHRLIALEAGHAAQNLLLCAEVIGAGACAVAAYHQPTLDALLGVDGDSEFALYLTAVGRVSPAAARTDAEGVFP